MTDQERTLLKNKIDKARLISFDVFDTLLFRKTNSPETIFDLVGKHFEIHGFRRLRIDMQNEASRREHEAFQYPHADMDQIYEVLAEHTEIPVNWDEVKAYEIQMERDALTANEELLEIFLYAKEQGKRVVAISDMYLFAETIGEILRNKGFWEIDHIYCSANERKAKFNKDLFEVVAKKENVDYKDILHIGDKVRDDGDIPASFGMETFIYNRECNLDKVKNVICSDVDQGLYKILYNKNNGFWYNLGVEVGGPLYMGLYRFLMNQVKQKDKKIFFLSRDGYNLYQIFKMLGYTNIEYLYTSRRALTLAAIENLDDTAIRSLPPYVEGQTVGEVWDYLCIDRNEIKNLEECGFRTFDDVIYSEREMAQFKQLYGYNKEVLLRRCRMERENAKAYFEKAGLFEQDAICFDCGWQGSSQELLERFKRAVGYETELYFIYFGIKNTDKSRNQLHGLRYETYLFDFYKNFSLQDDTEKNVILYELFFSAPHESAYYYGENGDVIFEDGEGDREKEEMLHGICDYISTGVDFVENYDVEYTPEIAVSRLRRLINAPTVDEAVNIGNLRNVDGFARKQGEEKFIAYTTKEQLEREPNIGTYWLEGFLKRPDISDEIKSQMAVKYGVWYPKEDAAFDFTDADRIRRMRSYARWMKDWKDCEKSGGTLKYKPLFSVIIPVYNTSVEYLRECIQSILTQSYDCFELILVDDCSTFDGIIPLLQKYEKNRKVRVLYRSVHGEAPMALNDAIQIVKGDYLVFVDAKDTIEEQALYELAKTLNENPELDLIYSDEDYMTADGIQRHTPFFKPDWSPDLLLSMLYTAHLSAYRTSIVKSITGFRTAYNGGHDYDLVLRFMEQSDHARVGHVAKVLYHCRDQIGMESYEKLTADHMMKAARNAKADYIRRNQIKAHLEAVVGTNQSRIVYDVVREPLVSVIILSGNQPEQLKRCIESIEKYTKYKNYEILVVESENEKRSSKALNEGAAQASGEYLLFMNDSIEVFQPEWMERMLGHAQQKHVGAVGAKLYEPLTTRIVHSGITISEEEPFFIGVNDEDHKPQEFYLNWIDRNCLCVSGACMMIQTEKFCQAGGFDETHPTLYGDMKLCLTLHQKGFYQVIRNDVAAYYHREMRDESSLNDKIHESFSGEELQSLLAEYKWLAGKDPFYQLNRDMESKSTEPFDELLKMKLSRCLRTKNGRIENVTVDNKIVISGWSRLEHEAPPDVFERYVVFEDPDGNTYGAKTVPCLRPDVVEYFGDKRYLYSGFECVVKPQNLKMDTIPYQMGILTIDKKRKRHLNWCYEGESLSQENHIQMSKGKRMIKKLKNRLGWIKFF
ncbi:MAG: glycosyltransferase [Lachnoclostridium sp.]|nr:glycosyltransferase [Lachnoclostridium sp.]